MKTFIRIQIPVISSNLNETLRIKIRREWWNIQISSSHVTALSSKEHEVPSSEWSEQDMKLDRKLQDLIDAVAGHIRNATYFAYGLTMQWGYEAYYGSTQATDSLDMFPSIHQQGSSTQYQTEDLEIRRSIFQDIGSSNLKPLIIMLNYWRRGEELDDLGFHTEAFLNYYKVLECLEALDENHSQKILFLDKFAPVKTVAGVTDRVPMATIRRKLGVNRSRGSLVKHIENSSKMLATANFTKVATGFMMYLMRLSNVRNDYNVAHALAYYNKYDTYRGIGQHSDEFEYVIQDLWNIRAMSKLLILNYSFPQKYKFDWKNRKWELR